MEIIANFGQFPTCVLLQHQPNLSFMPQIRRNEAGKCDHDIATVVNQAIIAE